MQKHKKNNIQYYNNINHETVKFTICLNYIKMYKNLLQQNTYIIL